MAVKLGDYVEISFGGDSGPMSLINGRYHRFQRELGRGAYKCVYHAYDTVDGVDVAWNAIDIDSLPNDAERDKIMREVEMLNGLKHSHILRIRDYWMDPLRHQLCFVTDIIQSGSLRRFIHDREVSLGSVKKWSRQILEALAYLHSREPSVIHRDIKCDNIFIDGPTGNVTIGDLGLSTHFASEAMNKGLSLVGTPEFMAPELYTEKYDVKVDIYAFGMCVLEMITKQYPYEEVDNPVALYRTVCDRVQPRALATINRPSVRAFVEFCVEFDPYRRPTAQECLDHPFLFYHDSHLDRMPCAKLVGQTSPARHVHVPRKLPTIRESRPRDPSRDKGGSRKNKTTSQLPYVYDCSAKFGDDKRQSVSVRLKLNLSGNNATRVAFQYNPRTESVQTVVADMVHKLNLNPDRVDEIVHVIDTQVGRVLNSEKLAISETQVKKSMRLEIADLAKIEASSPRGSGTDQSDSGHASTAASSAEQSADMLTVNIGDASRPPHSKPAAASVAGLTTSSPQHICVPTESSSTAIIPDAVGSTHHHSVPTATAASSTAATVHSIPADHLKPSLSLPDESLSEQPVTQSVAEVGTPTSVKSEGGKSSISIPAVPALPTHQPAPNQATVAHLSMQPPMFAHAPQFRQHPGMPPGTMIAQYPYPMPHYSYRMAVPMGSYSEPPSSSAHAGPQAMNLHVPQQPAVIPARSHVAAASSVTQVSSNPTAAAVAAMNGVSAPVSAAVQQKNGPSFSSQLKSETLDDSMLIETMAELKKLPSLVSDELEHGTVLSGGVDTSMLSVDADVEMPPPLVMITDLKSTDSRKSDTSLDFNLRGARPTERENGDHTGSLTQSCDDLVSEHTAEQTDSLDKPAIQLGSEEGTMEDGMEERDEEKADVLQDQLEDLYTEKTRVYKEAVETEKSRLEDTSHKKELGSAQVELRKKLRGIDKQISALKKKGVKRKKSNKKDSIGGGGPSMKSAGEGGTSSSVNGTKPTSVPTAAVPALPPSTSKTGSTSSFEDPTAAEVSPSQKNRIMEHKSHQKSPMHHSNKANSSSPITHVRESLGNTEGLRGHSMEPGRLVSSSGGSGLGLPVPAPPQPSCTDTETVSGFAFPHHSGRSSYPIPGVMASHSSGTGGGSEDSSSSLFHHALFAKHHGDPPPPAAFTPPSEIALLLVGDYMKRFPAKLSLNVPSNLKPDISSPYNDALEKASTRLASLSKRLRKKYEFYKSDIAELMTVYSERGLSDISVDRCVEKVEDMKRSLEELFQDVVADQIDLVDRTRQLKILAQSVVAQQSILNQPHHPSVLPSSMPATLATGHLSAAGVPSVPLISSAHSPSAAATAGAVGGFFDQPMNSDGLPPVTGLRLSRSQTSLNGMVQPPSTGGSSAATLTSQISSGTPATLPPGMISAAPMYPTAPFGAHYAFMPSQLNHQPAPHPQVMYISTQMTHPSMQNCVTPRSSIPVGSYQAAGPAMIPHSQHTSMPVSSVSTAQAVPPASIASAAGGLHHISPPASVASESGLIATDATTQLTVPSTMEGVPERAPVHQQ